MRKTLPSNAALIPDNASLAFKGQIFDVYQWPQIMFDGSTKTFEMLKRPDTVQIILVRDNKILLVEDEQPGRTPRIHFPGGRADEDDSWEAAAKRELREETGFVCANLKLVRVEQPTIKIEWFTPVFLATGITEEGEQQLDADGEKITLQWHAFEDVRRNVLSGREQMMQYLVPFFNQVQTLEELLALPAFDGIEAERP
jgi:8-oxo-dGTP pyrophosphatase MutT (NUDIX family)